MDIILYQKITMTAPRLDYKNVYKKIESPRIPQVGEYIGDTVFTDSTKIMVKMEEIVKKYILHGWTTIDE